MAKLKGYSLDVGYPIYGAKFLNNTTLSVAGGGGEGKNGVPNKLTALVIQPDHPKKPIRRFRELTLNDQEDCPMSLDANNGIILLGVNENSEMIRKGVNKHLRKFKYVNEHLKFVESAQISPSSDAQIYQKITVLSKDANYGVIAMSDNPSSVFIVDTSSDLVELYKISSPGDVKDICISPDGKMMCYITTSQIEGISMITGRSVFKKDIDSFMMSKASFYDNNVVVLSGSTASGIAVAHFSISKSAVVKQSVVYKNLKGVTSMDLNVNSGLVALAGSDCSLLLVRYSDLKLLRKINKVHNFAITKVTSSEDGKYLASVSAANTVNVLVVPANFADSKSLFLSIFELLLSILLMAGLAAGTQYLYVNGYLEQAKVKGLKVYEEWKQKKDSSSYFTIQPIESSETFIKGPPTTTTYLPTDATVKSDIISISGEVTTVTPNTETIASAISNAEADDESPAEEIVVPSDNVAELSSELIEDTSSLNADDFAKRTQPGIVIPSGDALKAFKSDVADAREKAKSKLSDFQKATQPGIVIPSEAVSELSKEVPEDATGSLDADELAKRTQPGIAIPSSQEDAASILPVGDPNEKVSILPVGSASQVELHKSVVTSVVTHVSTHVSFVEVTVTHHPSVDSEATTIEAKAEATPLSSSSAAAPLVEKIKAEATIVGEHVAEKYDSMKNGASEKISALTEKQASAKSEAIAAAESAVPEPVKAGAESAHSVVESVKSQVSSANVERAEERAESKEKREETVSSVVSKGEDKIASALSAVKSGVASKKAELDQRAAEHAAEASLKIEAAKSLEQASLSAAESSRAAAASARAASIESAKASANAKFEEFKTAASEKVDNVNVAYAAKVDEVKAAANKRLESIKSAAEDDVAGVEAKAAEVKAAVEAKAIEASAAVQSNADAAKQAVEEKAAAAKASAEAAGQENEAAIKAKVDESKRAIDAKAAVAKQSIADRVAAVKISLDDKVDAVKAAAAEKAAAIKKIAEEKAAAAKSAAEEKAASAKDAAASKVDAAKDNAKTAVHEKVGAAKSAVESEAAAIKSAASDKVAAAEKDAAAKAAAAKAAIVDKAVSAKEGAKSGAASKAEAAKEGVKSAVGAEVDAVKAKVESVESAAASKISSHTASVHSEAEEVRSGVANAVHNAETSVKEAIAEFHDAKETPEVKAEKPKETTALTSEKPDDSSASEASEAAVPDEKTVGEVTTTSV